MARSLKVAVIGAGVAGLVSARELQREGHQVVVFEKSDHIGGTWVYSPKVDSDPLGLDPNREVVHGSLYSSLRTNLPRHLMGFTDYPFTIKKNGELRNFPGHEEVLKFLQEFARDFGLIELIRFNTEVVRVKRVSLSDDQWLVKSKTSELNSSEEVFEAVVVCNGHYTQPKIADLPGIENWQGKQVHSHNYRVPHPFENQIVIVIGDGPSAHDISNEIALVAKEVHLSSRSPQVKVSQLGSNIWQHSKIVGILENGEVAFEDGPSICADVIFHCTGYKYEFPFLETNDIVTVDDNRVGPLYKHVFPPELAPRLSFVGLTFRVVIFLMMELQSKWVAHVLSGKVLLPSKEEMLADVEEHYRNMEKDGIPKHHTHSLHPHEFEYLDWLAAQVGLPPVEERQKEIYWNLMQIVGTFGWVGFREWDVDNGVPETL